MKGKDIETEKQIKIYSIKNREEVLNMGKRIQDE